MQSRPDLSKTTRLKVRGLNLTLPTGRRLIEDASVEVHAGQVVVILGESGAGKSTLGDVLFGLLQERAPGSRVSATQLTANPEKMALILQRGSLFDHLSVVDNIRFAARRTRNRQLASTEVLDLLNEVGLRPDASADVNGLSGGEERRVTVARGLATQPEFIFFDEPTAGLDLANVRRIGALIQRVCREHSAGAIVVTHNPLLAALCADEVLFLDRRSGGLAPLLKRWPGPAALDDKSGIHSRRAQIETALLTWSAADDEHPAATGPSRSPMSAFTRALSQPFRVLTGPGRLAKDLLVILASLPASLAHPRDFLQLGWRSLVLTGYSGLPFFALVAAIFSATFLSIAFAAAQLVSPQTIVENLRGDFVLALTPPLCGFLFAARSGSALSAWLGGLALRRQTDALRSLGVSVDAYLRVPAFVGTFLGFILTTIVFGAAMYGAAVLTASGFDVDNAAGLLQDTSVSFRRQLIQKTLIYGVIVGLVATHLGLTSKRNSHEVARGITRTIILCTLGIVLCELFFAVDLHG